MPSRFVAVFSLMVLLAVGCTTTQLTQRPQLLLIPDAQVNSLAMDSYRQTLAESKILSEGKEADLVQRVGARLAQATQRYLSERGVPDPGFAWEFNLIDDPQTVNAWCMPGGKVAVYTGLLPIAQNEDALAVVIGHEIAHAVAKHGNERMSQALAQQGLAELASAATANKSAHMRTVIQQLYGIGSQVGVLLPYSRLHENEADWIGLDLAAMGGYDPRAAIPLWQRMASSGGPRPPQFLSTHPDPTTRIQRLQEHLPQSLALYERQARK